MYYNWLNLLQNKNLRVDYYLPLSDNIAEGNNILYFPYLGQINQLQLNFNNKLQDF